MLVAILTPFGLPAATNTLDDVVSAVRDGLAHNQLDVQMARAIHRLNLKFRLDNHTAEELESLAPGPKSIAELERQRDITRELPSPADLPSFQSPPEPKADELRDVIAEARRKALNYSASLPDFICTEAVRRYEGNGKGEWNQHDSLTVQLSYFDHEENYKLTALNGHKTERTYDEMGGALSKGEFGSMLLSVFVPTSRTKFRWLNWTTLRKRTSYVIGFRIDPKDSTYMLRVGRYGAGEVSTVPGQHGFVYIDRETKDVLRIDCEADSIPTDFPLENATRLLDYGEADVGGRMYLLPLHAEVRMMPRGGWSVTRNDVEFTAFRKFTGESTISFGDPSDAKPDDKTKPNPVVKK
jgi:hypothetical protein